LGVFTLALPSFITGQDLRRPSWREPPQVYSYLDFGPFCYRYLFVPVDGQDDEAQQKIGEAEIAYEVMGFNKGMAASNIATSNEEMVELYAEFSKLLSDYCLMSFSRLL